MSSFITIEYDPQENGSVDWKLLSTDGSVLESGSGMNMEAAKRTAERQQDILVNALARGAKP